MPKGKPERIGIRMETTILSLQNWIKSKIYKQSVIPFYRVVFQILKILIFVFIRFKKLYLDNSFDLVYKFILKKLYKLDFVSNFAIIYIYVYLRNFLLFVGISIQDLK